MGRQIELFTFELRDVVAAPRCVSRHSREPEAESFLSCPLKENINIIIIKHQIIALSCLSVNGGKMVPVPDRFRSVAIWLLIAGTVHLSHGVVAELPDPADLPQRRFRTAEMADAVMGAPQSAGLEPLQGEACVGGRCEESSPSGETKSQNFTEPAKTYKVSCDRRNVTGIELFTVQLLNASQDLMELLNANSTECSLVLFYTTWCQFSASLAPHFNALPRVFPSMHFLALDASQHSSLSTRFGTVAVPNILLFQGAKPMARFNQTDRTLETLTSFITNQTGFEASPDQTVRDEDRVGPLPSVPVKSIDWLFVFSVLFISGFTLYAILCSDSVRWLVPGPDHEHQD
ncbi:thioredoxin domain-containing protein 15-like isoform X2 [Sinocyclocheilus rhinocerous]|uniref:thioredoxin domain-containing protein 15-like isoform X2 n=1 Tax=Sinocyclocheilus rhinocerous TaxID=307959 RepID=UPI0007BA3E84|nr:PREDICTED: thioredoxin domain-containing protein 15-like isoform X2 [Sinocyclocheilus rhinocerous]